MAIQRPDSPNARQIVRSFLNFLDSIESTSDEVTESVEVARDCLRMAFGLNWSSTDEGVPLPQGLLLDLFSSWEAKQQHKLTYGSDADLNSTISAEHSHVSATVQVEDKSKQELNGRLYDAILSKSLVQVDPDQAAKAPPLFNIALAGCLDQIESSDKIADFFKSKVNQAMQSKQDAGPMKLYTEALCKNREAAYIQLNKNLEAIKGCLKAIEINTKYSESNSKLGSTYLALRKYNEALNKGFLEALKLDPDNQTIQENIEMTRFKLNQECQEKILAFCNSNQVGSFSNGSNSVNREFLSDYIESLLHWSQQRTNLAESIMDQAEAFLHWACESNSDSSGSREVESDNVPVLNVSDALPSTAQVFAELAGPNVNQAMRSKQDAEPIKLYTEALCNNREAAYLQLNKNLEAIKDCLKAIEIDRKYSESYSKLGSAHLALGKYHEALNKGFMKALKLDPDNQTIQDNIEMTRSKLNQELQEKILAFCNSQVRSFSNGNTSVNREFFSDIIKGLLHLSQQHTNSADPLRELAELANAIEGLLFSAQDSADSIRDQAEAFLHRAHESNSDSSGSREVESDNMPVLNVSDALPSTEHVFAELVGPIGSGPAA